MLHYLPLREEWYTLVLSTEDIAMLHYLPLREEWYTLVLSTEDIAMLHYLPLRGECYILVLCSSVACVNLLTYFLAASCIHFRVRN